MTPGAAARYNFWTSPTSVAFIPQKTSMKTYHKIWAAFLALCFMTVSALAAETSPAGTWKYSQPGFQGGEPTERTIVLEYKDGKVTGTVKGVTMGQFEIPDAAVSDGTFKDGIVSFTTTLDFGGNKFVSKYTGKLEGDKITGSRESPGRGGEGAPIKTDWVATRAK